MIRFLVIAFAVCVVLVATASGQTVSVMNPNPISSPTGHVDIFFKIEPLAKDAKLAELVVKDVTDLNSPTFQQLGSPIFVGRSDTKVYWRTSWQIDARALSSGSTRTLFAQFGNTSELLAITLQKLNIPQVTVVGPGTPLKLIDSRSVAIQIISSASLTNVQPSFSTLSEEKTGQVIPVSKLFISLKDSPTSGQMVDAEMINAPAQVVWLNVATDVSLPGKFTGNISLSSREKADLGTFAITIYSTSFWWKGIGALFILVGVSIYFSAAIWAKAKNKQLMAALPAARFREEAQSLKSLVLDASKQTQASFPNLLGVGANPNSLDFLIESLSVSELKSKGFLPQNFFSAFSDQDTPASYQAFLATIGSELSALELIVRWGIGAVVRMWPEVSRIGAQVAGAAAFQKLDSFVGAALPLDQLRVQVQTAISTLQSALAPPQALAGGAAVPSTPTDLAPREITIRLEELSLFVWILWGAATVFVGLCALILFNDAFGRTQDFIQCILWGIGMPAVAQGFGGLSASSVTSALSITVPR